MKLLEPMRLDQVRYRIVAEISNFDPEANFQGMINVPSSDIFGRKIAIDTIVDGRIEIETETLDAFSSYSASIWLNSDRSDVLIDNINWITGPPEVTMVPSVLGDTAVLTVTGYGLGGVEGIQLGIRATPGADEVLKPLSGFIRGNTSCSARIPVLLAHLPSEPPTFPGAVQPATVHLFHLVRTDAMALPMGVAVGTIQLAYRMGTPNPASGVAGSNFELVLFHPARAPDLAGVTVFFDDIALTPLSVVELADITVSGLIYGTRSQFRVPAGAAPGLHQLRGVTAYDEELLVNHPEFQVVAAAP